MSRGMLTPEQRIRQQYAWFQEAERLGNVMFACRRLGISRKTFYKWRKRNGGVVMASVSLRAGLNHEDDLRYVPTKQDGLPRGRPSCLDRLNSLELFTLPVSRGRLQGGPGRGPSRPGA